MSWTAAAKHFIDLARHMPSAATMLVLLAIIGWLVYGYLGVYAKADELDAVKSDVAQLKKDVETIKTDGKLSRLENLEAQMFQARVDHCKAQPLSELKRIYAARIADLEVKYRNAGGIPGQTYRLPQCQDL